MKKIATALAGAALLVSLAAPADAAVVSRPRTVIRSTNQRHPEHDGNGWLLF